MIGLSVLLIALLALHAPLHKRRREFVLVLCYVLLYAITAMLLPHYPSGLMSSGRGQIIPFMVAWALYGVNFFYLDEVYDLGPVLRFLQVLSLVVFSLDVIAFMLDAILFIPLPVVTPWLGLGGMYLLLFVVVAFAVFRYKRHRGNILITCFFGFFVALTWLTWAGQVFREIPLEDINNAKNGLFLLAVSTRMIYLWWTDLHGIRRSREIRTLLRLFPRAASPVEEAVHSGDPVVVCHVDTECSQRLAAGFSRYRPVWIVNGPEDIAGIAKLPGKPLGIVGGLYCPGTDELLLDVLDRQGFAWFHALFPYIVIEPGIPDSFLASCFRRHACIPLQRAMSPAAIIEEMENRRLLSASLVLQKDAAAAVPDKMEIAWRQKAESRGITHRELQIIEMITQGTDYDTIASILSISRNTLKRHVSNIYDKCGVNNRLMLLKWLQD